MDKPRWFGHPTWSNVHDRFDPRFNDEDERTPDDMLHTWQ